MRAFCLGVLIGVASCGWTAGEIFATGGDAIGSCGGVLPGQVGQVEDAIHTGGIGWLGVALSAITDATCLAGVVAHHVEQHQATVAGPAELAKPETPGERWRASVVIATCAHAKRVHFRRGP